MWELKVGVLLLTMEIMDVGCNTLSKAAMAHGLSSFIFTTYTHGFALFFLLPLAFFYHRKTPAPPIGISMILRLCLLGFVCGSSSMLLFLGIRYSSPTLSSAMNNLTPAITFIVAIIFRMEKLNIKAYSGLLKLIGTVVSILGAFIVTFYQGLPIILWPSSPVRPSLASLFVATDEQQNWVWGAFLLATSSIFLSISYIVKTWIARDLESEILITIISFIAETGMAALVTLVAEPDRSVWLPTKEIVLIALLYGAVEVGVVNTVQTWACGKKGPLFVAMFKPLQMIIAVIMGVSFLKDVLHIGSVIGGTVIALGFYTVMKGKTDEEKDKYEDMVIYQSEKSHDHKIPLLQNNVEQV